MLVLEEVEKRVGEVGGFSSKLEEVLLFLLKETREIRETQKAENDARKAEIEKSAKAMEALLNAETDKIKEIIKKENEERQRDMKDIEAYVRKESAERRKEMGEVKEKLQTEEEKRLNEAKLLAEKMEREKKQLQEYVEKDAREAKERMAAENQKMQDKLDKEAADLKKKLQDADEEKGEEMKIMQSKIDMERKMLQEKMEREKEELAEEMERQEAERKKEAANLKNKMEEEAKQTQSGIVTMFERLKGENESRKTEIHGLKDILVRENERLARDQMALGQKLDNNLVDLNEKIDREVAECRKDTKTRSDELKDTMKDDKKEMKDKMELEYQDLRKKVELESNELRDKMQYDKKAIISKFEEVEDERQKEAKLIRAQLQREREETRDLLNSESKLLQDQLDGNTRELMDVIKREKGERERENESIKRKVDDEKQELQMSIDRDRDNLTKRLNEEHDQRRIEAMEVQQRLESNEKSGKNDMQELFARVKRYEEEARIDNDEVRQSLGRVSNSLEEKLAREKKDLREALDHETMDLSKRVDKCNIERLNESADLQSKLAMLGKSASRHIDQLKNSLHRESQLLLEMIQKTCSVAFNAFREDNHAEGGECYITFTSCSVNIGNGFVPKSGIFQCPEPGLYLFTLAVCTYDGKKCLLIIKKNEKDVCALIDQDGDENRGKTMINQTCFMELEIGDRVQVYAVTGTGLSDTRNSHYTQFSGVMLRPSPDTFRSALRQAQAENEDDLSIGESSLRGFTPSRDLRGTSARRGPSVTRTITSPPPPGAKQNGVAPVQNGAEPAAPVQNGDAPVTPKERSKKKEKDADKPQQSYLALTGLGGAGEKKDEVAAEAEVKSPKAEVKSPKAEKPKQQQQQQPPQQPQTPKDGKKAESNAFYSFLKR